MNHYKLAIKHTGLLMALLLIVGCSRSAFQPLDFDKINKKGYSPIKTIALTRIDEPVEINVGTEGTPGKSFFGLMGAAAGWSIDKSRSKSFRQALNEHDILFAPAMVESLQQELTKKGYEFIYLQNQAIMPAADGKSFDFSQIQTDADAILFVYLYSVGYRAPKGFDKKYYPMLIVSVNLLDGYSKAPMYLKSFTMLRSEKYYGAEYSEIMIPDAGFYFDSIDALMSNIDEAAQGIKDCQGKIAARIAEQLK